MSLEEENDILNGQDAAIQKAIELEQQRQAEAEKTTKKRQRSSSSSAARAS